MGFGITAKPSTPRHQNFTDSPGSGKPSVDL